MNTDWLRKPLTVVALAAFAGTPAAGRSPRHALTIPQGFSGVVVVAREGEVLLSKASGTAKGRSIRLNSKFWIASVGKQFVAAAIMKLIDRGDVHLDDPLGRFIPEAPKDKAAITVRQLLSHTSGFAQSYVSEEQTDRSVAVQRMLAQPLAGVPGDKFRYSNSNTQLAAAIVEIVSGMSYGKFVERNLWGPAGLQATGMAGDAGGRSVTAIDGKLPTRLQGRYWGEQGAYSTATDLLRWYRALTRGKIVRAATAAEMFRPIVKIGEGYATQGWFRGTTARGDDFLFVRGNEDFGANALLYAYPRSHIVIVVLTHAGDVPGQDKSWSRLVQQSLEQQLNL